MKVYELMNVLAEMSAGANVCIYSVINKNCIVKDGDDTLVDLDVTGIMDYDDDTVLLEVR